MVMGVQVEQLASDYPVLYHMAAAGSWDSIRRHGLLSTSALLDLFEVAPDERRLIEEAHRPDSVVIHHPSHGSAVVRDQKPMSDSGLQRALRGGITPLDWYRLLNERVFFWVRRERLLTLLNAKAYRNSVHTVLEVSTYELLESYRDKVRLCPINSGCTKPFPHERDERAFRSLEEYDYTALRKKKRKDAVVELSVLGGVPDISKFTLRAYEMTGDEMGDILFERTS